MPLFVRLGAADAFLAVALGAFGAHGLHLDAEAARIYETAARYQMYHALALVLLGALPAVRTTRWSGLLFLAGTLLFSGSLYALALTGLRWLGAITPVGGLCFLLGWALLALARLGD